MTASAASVAHGRRSATGQENGHARCLVAVGGSAGGIPALERIVAALPADVPAAFCIVVHFPPHATSVLPQILAHAGPLRAAHAQDGEWIQEGQIYVAPPDRHLCISDGRLRLSREARINRNRPAIDPLLRSAGLWFQDRSIGVILSGNLDDGTAGLRALKRFGGTAVVQEPTDATHPDMPRNAMDFVAVDHVVAASAIGALLDSLARSVAARPPLRRLPADTSADHVSPDPSGLFICPDCGGVLQPTDDGPLVHFDCRLGHEYSPETLYAAQIEEARQALWMAMRTLSEKVEVATRLAARFRAAGDTKTGQRYADRARNERRQVDALRFLIGREPAASDAREEPTREPAAD